MAKNNEALCDVCKIVSEEKDCMERERERERERQRQRLQDEKCKEAIEQHIQRQVLRGQNMAQNNNCQEKQQQGAFDDQESFMLSRQVNTELTSFYSYLTLFAHYDRDDVALKGFAQYYLRMAYEELEHALKIIRYMNKRGGRAKFCEIKAPERQSWNCARESIGTALEIEKKETAHLMELHGTACEKQDHHLSQYLTREFMDVQLDTMNELGCKMTQLGMVGEGAGLYLYDRNLLKEERKRNVQKYI